MVHEQEESHHITTSRKRSNPFIQWLNSESPPHSRSSSDTDSQSDPESFSAALPSPPLQSNTYNTFKKDLDIFGGSWKKETGGGGGGREGEKDRTQRCWTSTDKTNSSHKMPPSCQPEGNKARKSEYGHSELISEDDARHESDISGPQESDEPRQKRPRYSVELKSSTKFDETYHPSIAEKIKLRERKYSQSYDETQLRSFQGKEIKRSPRHQSSNLYHPYREKLEVEEESPGKIFIQIPAGTEKKTLLTSKISVSLTEGPGTPSDKNHNKLSESEMFLKDSRNPVQLRPPSTDPDSPEAPGEEPPESPDPPKVTASQVTLQPHTQKTFWQLREEKRNGSSLADRNYKQICRSRKFNTRYPAPEKPRQKRAVIQDMVRPLKQWLLRHRHNPYPTKAEKLQLAVGSNMTLVQVSNWFANARRRLKNVVQESRCSWSKRLRLYNQCVQGNAELLSISSDDSIWNSEDEEDDRQSDAGNTDEFDLDDTVVVEHSYSRGQQAVSVTSSEGDLEGRERDSSLGEHISAAASPTDTSGTPPASPSSSPHNIPDTNKYKINMLRRYLNDAAEAAESFSADRADVERSSVSDTEEQQAQPSSNNITISFTPSPLDSSMVPILSQPPRDEMGVEKVKRGLAETNQPQDEFSSSDPTAHQSYPDLGLAASEEVTTLPAIPSFTLPPPASASHPPASGSGPGLFSPPILRHLSVLPLAPAPAPYPFFQPTLNTWPAPFTPIPHFLHLIPHSSCSELGTASAPPAVGGEGGGGGGGGGGVGGGGPGGPWMPGSTPGAGPTRGWVERVELDAAVALSQLAHSAQGHCPPAPPILVTTAGPAAAGPPPPGPGLAATLLKPPSCT